MARSGPALLFTRNSAASGTIWPELERTLSWPMSSASRAERRVGLYAHRVGSPKRVEVVNIERAQIDLQRLEHGSDRHAELPRLGPINVRKDLRNVDLIGSKSDRSVRARP